MIQIGKHLTVACLTSQLVVFVCHIGSSLAYQTGTGAYRANGVNYAAVPGQPGIAFAATDNGMIKAAVQTRHKIDFVEIPSMSDIKPTLVEVDARIIPINILFRSSSSRLRVQQVHQGASAGETRETTSEDEPHHLRHTVTKPIVQEVREIISPFRRIVQEIQPVQEEIQTIVARGLVGHDVSLKGHQYANGHPGVSGSTISTTAVQHIAAPVPVSVNEQTAYASNGGYVLGAGYEAGQVRTLGLKVHPSGAIAY